MQKPLIYVTLVLVITGLSGCTNTPKTSIMATPESSTTSSIVSHGGEVTDQVSLIDNLRSKGFTVEIGDSVEQPFLKARGSILKISNGSLNKPIEVQAYNYDDTDLKASGIKTAEEDAKNIDSDGNPKTTSILWVDDPHFYRKERVIVLYLGKDKTMLQILSELLGTQFAGR